MVWEPIKSGATVVADWISSKFKEARKFVEGIYKWFADKYEAVSGWAKGVAARGEEITGLHPTAHATGGILTRPHLGLVAEAGPEAIIPLSARMRGRATALWEETGRYLGVKPYARGGFAGVSAVAPVAVGAGISALVSPAMKQAGNSPVNVTNYINVSITEAGGADPDRIAETIAIKIKSVFQNMPIT